MFAWRPDLSHWSSAEFTAVEGGSSFLSSHPPATPACIGRWSSRQVDGCAPGKGCLESSNAEVAVPECASPRGAISIYLRLLGNGLMHQWKVSDRCNLLLGWLGIYNINIYHIYYILLCCKPLARGCNSRRCYKPIEYIKKTTSLSINRSKWGYESARQLPRVYVSWAQ